MDRRLIFRHPCVKVEPAEDAGTRRIGVIDAPVPQGRRHSIRKSVELPATKSPAGDDTTGPYRNPTQVC